MKAPDVPRLALLVVLATLSLGCETAPEPPPATAALLTGEVHARLVTVRPCRASVEHPFNHVRVLVEPELRERYERGPFPFTPGTLVVKEEFSDPGCATRVGITLMQKQPAGYDPAFSDWRWQRLDADGRLLEDGPVRTCASCHATAACRARDFVCSDVD